MIMVASHWVAPMQPENAPSPSLRANGSRECAPDDRLREAIQKARKKSWIASSQELLAMTGRDFRQPLPVIASAANVRTG
jgi:hypothetical protein